MYWDFRVDWFISKKLHSTLFRICVADLPDDFKSQNLRNWLKLSGFEAVFDRWISDIGDCP
jgi:hypothetical protein